ncbi:MAG: TlyA family RNA methyltransferase [Anaerolineales bacterium]|nr:MAG: TlyA family RNA methyltransferase [Anaerolineales bacterium]
MPKQRADLLLVQRGLAETRSQAQRLLMAGQVRYNGQLVEKPGALLPEDAALELAARPPYVSRGGEKLQAALDAFGIAVTGWVAADVGASTGGFTDCLLQRGAVKVYAIDVGKGQLHWQLRQDARVVVMEETNARNVQALPELVDGVVVDASFISLKTLLPVFQAWLKPSGQVVALIKPQFEAGKKEVARGKGVIRDAAVHRRVLEDTLAFVGERGLAVRGLLRSPVLGPKGNVEFLLWAQMGGVSIQPDLDAVLAAPTQEDKDG